MRACDANHVFAFVLCSHRKFITLRVLDREEYEKECSFFLVLGDPVWLRRGVKGVRVKTRPSSRDAAAFSVSPYSHTPFSSLFASWPVCPPSSEAWPLHLFALSPFLFHLERTPSHSGSQECSWDHPRVPGQEHPQPSEIFWEFCPAELQLHLHLIKENIQPRQVKRAALHHFYQKIKQLSLEIKRVARAVILAFFVLALGSQNRQKSQPK